MDLSLVVEAASQNSSKLNICPIFPANNCPPDHQHPLVSTNPAASLLFGKYFSILWLLGCWIFFPVMILCLCRSSWPEAQPADGAESPAGRSGTSRGAFRGKRERERKSSWYWALSSCSCWISNTNLASLWQLSVVGDSWKVGWQPTHFCAIWSLKTWGISMQWATANIWEQLNHFQHGELCRYLFMLFCQSHHQA